MSDFASPADSKKSTVKLTLLDPLGRGISGLKYHVSEGDNIFIRGVTNDQGEGRSFTSSIGARLDVYVKRFDSGGMKKIKTIVPNLKIFSVKLFSNKIKETMTLEAVKGDPGDYRRKTRMFMAGDIDGNKVKKNGATTATREKITDNKTPSASQRGQDPNIFPTPIPADEKSAFDNASGDQMLLHSGNQLTSKSETRKTAEIHSIQKVPTEKINDRDINGTPKVTIGMVCGQKACIKVGMRNSLIEEINIRLTGFGGSVKSDVTIDEFTTDTESAVKNFQRDYMNVPDTGKVCVDVLTALDEFKEKFPLAIDEMRCKCGQCTGFGQQYQNSEPVKIYKANGEPINGIEYPGMHKGLVWLFRASLFYTTVKDKGQGYSFLKIASGYRCWNDNKIHNRNTFNHMGNALDLQFSRQAPSIRCIGQDLENLRKSIFIARLGAKMRWETRYQPSLEATVDGATSWVHVDVRTFGSKFKLNKYYAMTQNSLDGESMMSMAKRLGMLALFNCGGVPALNAFVKAHPVASQ